MWITPNALTIIRILLVPVMVVVLTHPGPLAGAVAAVLFVIAAFTDYFDGYLARKHGIVTKFGQFLDPLADKLIVTSALIMLAAMPCGGDPCVRRLSGWIVVLIVGRELAVTGLRGIAQVEGITLEAGELGKYKTIFQIFALTGLLVHYRYLHVDFHTAGMLFLWVSLILGLWSAVDYHVRVFQRLRLAHVPMPPNVDTQGPPS